MHIHIHICHNNDLLFKKKSSITKVKYTCQIFSLKISLTKLIQNLYAGDGSFSDSKLFHINVSCKIALSTIIIAYHKWILTMIGIFYHKKPPFLLINKYYHFHFFTKNAIIDLQLTRYAILM